MCQRSFLSLVVEKCDNLFSRPFYYLICVCFYSRLNEYRPSKKRWDLSRLPKIEKNLYKEHPTVLGRSEVREVVIISFDAYFNFVVYGNIDFFVNTG